MLASTSGGREYEVSGGSRADTWGPGDFVGQLRRVGIGWSGQSPHLDVAGLKIARQGLGTWSEC